MRILEFERKVRSEAFLGCQQIKYVENRLRDAPEGGLLGEAEGADAQALRTTILNASAAIVEKFSKVIRLLSTPPSATRSTNSMATGGSKAQDQLVAKAGNLTLDADSPLLSGDDCHTPGRMQFTSPTTSPCDTPLSGSGLSEGGSPVRPNHVAPDSDEDTVGNLSRRQSHDVSTSAADPDLSDKPALPKKRKYFPKGILYQTKQRAIGTGDNDGPPDDGFTWRKYGQKDIKESSYARSYYRCTHKTDLGCPSIKMVQRSDEDPNYYDVTYRGNHICPLLEQRTWHIGLAPSHIAIHELLGSDPKGSSSSALIMGSGALHLSTPGQSQENVIVGLGPSPFPPPKSTSGLTAVPCSRRSNTGTITSTTITTTTGSPEHNQIGGPRVGMSSASTAQQQQQQQETQQNIPAKVAANANCRLDQDYNQSRSARDCLFSGSNLRSLLLGRTDGGSLGLELEDLSVHQVLQQQQQRQTTANQGGGEMERMREIMRGQISHDSVSVSMADSADASRAQQQYGERWAESNMLVRSFQQQQRPPAAQSEVTGQYTPSPATSEVGTSHVQQIRPAASQISLVPSYSGPGAEIYNIHTTESDASEVISSEPSPSLYGGIPSTMGMPPYMIGSPGSHQQLYMDDYDFGSYYEQSQTD
ncbi:hypothetical protein AXG93_2318s1030 [Marchantia polymorpha subsp. ruderalis]|uniref:WRKY domain-containing protein n=1 Tax=Marchantia polymorpha subsp. ruderalis TaxID=1480154 RepID=A0A176VNX5_MARPO|nr:hypothetical protein AXG93_2318s1030 [Marchantia polymorpha subsp. ruderalis]